MSKAFRESRTQTDYSGSATSSKEPIATASICCNMQVETIVENQPECCFEQDDGLQPDGTTDRIAETKASKLLHAPVDQIFVAACEGVTDWNSPGCRDVNIAED